MAEKNSGEKIAIVRVRGLVNVRHDIKLTLKQLRLEQKNVCVILPKNESTLGMIQKIKDYVTWGPVDDATFNMLVEKRGEEYKGRTEDSKGKIKYDTRYVEINGKKYKKFFRLNSPKSGFGKKGIKIPFVKGGGIGNRGDKIKDLITSMI